MRTVGVDNAGDMARSARRRIVLPRLLRRPARMLSRAQWAVPNRAGLKLTAVLFAVTGTAGMIIGGHTLEAVSASTAWAGLAIDRVEIKGQSETSEFEVLQGLALGEYPSIVTLDVLGARARIESLPWVKEATLRKVYPDKLEIEIRERKPYAVWQYEGGFALLEDGGHVISRRVEARHSGLPLVVGKGADARVHEFVALMEEFPGLGPRVRAGVLVSERRWNIVLQNGVEIMLPQDDPASALIQAVALDDGHGVFSREIAAIDMRQASRLVFRLTEEGARARADLVKEREKARKKRTSA